MKPVTPLLTVDIIIKHHDKIVLIERKNKPFGWAIPGGFVDVGETVEQAAIREAKEETNLDVRLLRQFHTYSDPARDPRGHTVSVVFIAEIAGGILKGKDDAARAAFFAADDLPSKIAFDHRNILQDFINNRY